MTKKKEITYSDALTEMESILEKIEHEELDVDELSSTLKRVSYLMKICRQKLRTAESEVEKILNDMDVDD